jgi:glycosyltransferase involved in cell wall biosynthesis
MFVVFIEADEDSKNCSLFNCEYPAKAINKVPGHKAEVYTITEFNQHTERVQKSCMEADLIIVERNLFGDTLPTMMWFKVRSKILAVTYDDAYDLMETSNVAHQFWIKSQVVQPNEKGEMQVINISPSPLEQFKWGLRESAGIICPSRVLADDWNMYAKTYRTHNYILPERYENAVSLFPHDQKELYIGWSGSMSHLKSFTDSGIAGALTYVVRKYPQVTILMTGDHRVYDRINVPEGRKKYSNYVPDDQYGNLLKSFDLGLAPLFGEYDRRRSWIKVLEYAFLKIPWIASNYETYEELGDYGTLTENGLENWKNALCNAIENIDAKRELANGKAYDFAMANTWDRNVGKLLSMYQEIINSKYQ